MLSEIMTRSKQFQSDVGSKVSKRQQIILQLIESPHFESWIYLDEVIRNNVEQQQDSGLKKIVRQCIEYNYRNVKSFAMLMYLYSLQQQGRIPLDGISWASWSSVYRDFCVAENELIIFNSWAFNPENYQKLYDIIQNTLQMIARYWGRFLSECKIPFTDLQFDSIVQWVLRMRTETPEKFELAQNLAQIIREINIIKHQKDYITKQPLILKKVFENIGQSISDSGNAFLLLQPEDMFNEKTIEYFCHIYDYYVTDLNEEYLRNVFGNLTVGGLTRPILLVIEKISSLLANNEEYFKLRHLYQYFIIPKLTKFKATKFLARQLYDLIRFYCVGFLKHCYIGQNGMDYLLEDVEEIEDLEVREKWVELAMVVGAANSLEDETKIKLKEKGIEYNKNIKQLPIDPTKVWNVTLRTGKKYKKYVKSETKQFRGIQNRANQCYIISAVQSLFFTQQLERILDFYRDSIRGKKPLLDELRILFSELAGRRERKNITISYLKTCGPLQFKESKSQEDSMQYLIQLFEQIEKQCRQVPGMLSKFQEIFKIDCQHTTKCLNCNKESTNVENTYIYTIPHTELLQLKTQQKQITDYKCENCGQVGKCQNIRKISPKSKIFIVHINRFSIKDGVCKKELSNQTILRKFLDYELVGMICHCGKNIDSGHYKYFAKIGSKQWVEMSDRNVLRFELQHEDEEFEREMQTDMAPYILFYRKVKG